MSDWINVKDKMPDKKDYGFFWSGEYRLAIFVCGVIHGYRDVVLGSYSYASKQWTDLYGEKIDAVTHWMSFPKMPESDDDAEDGCMKEVNEGEWIVHYNDPFPAESTEECSICHVEQYINGNSDNYCPNCGAKMKQEKG